MLVTKLESAGRLRREPVQASNTLWLTPAGEVLVRRQPRIESELDL